MEQRNDNVIDMVTKKTKEEKFKKKAELIKDIAITRATSQMQDSRTLAIAAGVGLIQGLKYGGSLKRGIKAWAATTTVLVGSNIVSGIIDNIDEIKKA